MTVLTSYQDDFNEMQIVLKFGVYTRFFYSSFKLFCVEDDESIFTSL